MPRLQDGTKLRPKESGGDRRRCRYVDESPALVTIDMEAGADERPGDCGVIALRWRVRCVELRVRQKVAVHRRIRIALQRDELIELRFVAVIQHDR